MSTRPNPPPVVEVPSDTRAWCCHIRDGVECDEPAVWWIGTTLAPDDYTHACAEHRSELTRDGDRVIALAEIGR